MRESITAASWRGDGAARPEGIVRVAGDVPGVDRPADLRVEGVGGFHVLKGDVRRGLQAQGLVEDLAEGAPGHAAVGAEGAVGIAGDVAGLDALVDVLFGPVVLRVGKPGGQAGRGQQGQVYYLNFKPEQDQQWQDLAAKYTAATGVQVKVVTAAEGTYEQTLTSEMAKSAAPTLFQVNGPVGLASWKDYCYDLSGSKLYGELTSDDFALKDGSAVDGIAYVIETYGIIYNKALLQKAGYTQADITNFASLKKVADDIQANASKLGIKGAFTSAGMDSSSDWRFKTHLANLPIYYEYKADGIGSTDAIKGTYLDNYKNIWDLYITDSTCSPKDLSAKTGDDAANEFANGEAVFYQNGTWAYDQIKAVGDDNLGMLPIYIGVDGEENQGLCTGSENYWCVNKNASEADISRPLWTSCTGA
jgi:raffinose/stachyose/melibiose transport system substrate-binding protein